MAEETRQFVCRRRRQRHFHDFVQQRKIAAFKLEIHFLTPEVQGVEQRAVYADLGRSQCRVCLDRIRLVCAAQREQRSAARPERSLHALETAFARQLQHVFRIVLACVNRVDLKGQVCVCRCIAVFERALIYRKRVDIWKFLRLALLAEYPVLLAVHVFFQHQLKFGQGYFRKRQVAAEEFQQVDLKIRMFEPRHQRVLAPRRVAHHDVVDDDARTQRKMHVQIAVDRKTSACRTAYFARNIRPREIPVEEIRCGDKQQQE